MIQLKIFSAWFLSVLIMAGCGNHAPLVPVAGKIPHVVFIGDSVTFNWGQPWASPDFQLFTSWTDKGVAGNDSGEVVDRFQTDVIDLHPDIVVILTGTNDTYPGWVLCGGAGAGYDNHNHDTCHSIAYMVGQAKANGIKVILSTIPPWNCADQSICAQATNADDSPGRFTRINALNGWIKAYGSQQSLVVVDYWTVLVSADQKTYVSSLTLDGVHPSPAGYDLMTPLVEDAIAAAMSQ